MKCAIIQPIYLPWAGYFNLIASVDCFVFLDDVQFEHRSWQSRNRILMNGQEHMLTTSVCHCKRSTLLSDIELSNQDNWRNRHIKTLRHAYSKTPFGGLMLDIVSPILADQAILRLADLNILLIESFCSVLNLTTQRFRASDLRCGGRRSEHLGCLCRTLSADHYLSPRGSRDYLEEDRFAEITGIALSYQTYEPQPYPQRGVVAFVSHLSIVDVFANLGPHETRRYIEG